MLNFDLIPALLNQRMKEIATLSVDLILFMKSKEMFHFSFFTMVQSCGLTL